eukprot:g47935.t1
MTIAIKRQSNHCPWTFNGDTITELPTINNLAVTIDTNSTGLTIASDGYNCTSLQHGIHLLTPQSLSILSKYYMLLVDTQSSRCDRIAGDAEEIPRLLPGIESLSFEEQLGLFSLQKRLKRKSNRGMRGIDRVEHENLFPVEDISKTRGKNL